MGAIKKIRVELLLLFLVTLNIFTTFSLDINIQSYFQNFNDNTTYSYLKKFFINITELGSSAWYLGLSLFFIIIFWINKKFKFLRIKKDNKISNLFLSSFCYIIIAGIVTQIGKNIIGRPRPNYSNFESGLNFSFFTFDSSYHSFPSGHSSTIFMVCFIFCATLPRLKYFFYFFASIIAFSRVIVGAHFFSDILAGALLALIVFKILNYIVENKYKKYSFFEIKFKENSTIYNLLIFLLISSLFLTVGPTLDLYLSALFYKGGTQFVLQSFDYFSFLLRDGFLPFLLVYILILPIFSQFFSIKKIFFDHSFSINDVLYVWISQVLTLLVLVNLVLKNLWGRARPGDTLNFGGEDYFSPWYEITNVCNNNCSFVSGDASVGFSIIIMYFLTKKVFYVYASVFSGFLLGFVRITEGAHFFSDILFAGLFIIFINFILYKIYSRYYVQ